MHNNVCIIAVFGLLLAACETPFVARDELAKDCTPAQSPQNITLGRAKIQARPPNRCIYPDDTIVFNISPGDWPAGDVEIKPKSTNPGHPQSDNWLKGSNSEGNRFSVTAPDITHFEQFCESFGDGECLFEYEVLVDDVGMLDPMFTIRR